MAWVRKAGWQKAGDTQSIPSQGQKMRANTSMKRFKRDQSGQGLLEFALIFLILMMIIMGIIGFGLIFNAHLTLNLAVNAAARSAAVLDYASQNPDESYDEPIYTEIIDTLILLSADNIETIIIFEPEDDGSIGSTYNALDGDFNYLHQNYFNHDRVQDNMIGVQVTYHQPVIVPFVSIITGEEVEIVKMAVSRIE
jgi:hypothetical protein